MRERGGTDRQTHLLGKRLLHLDVWQKLLLRLRCDDTPRMLVRRRFRPRWELLLLRRRHDAPRMRLRLLLLCRLGLCFRPWLNGLRCGGGGWGAAEAKVLEALRTDRHTLYVDRQMLHGQTHIAWTDTQAATSRGEAG